MVFSQCNISDTNRLDQDWRVKLIAVKFYNPSDWPISFRLHAWPLDTWTHDDSTDDFVTIIIHTMRSEWYGQVFVMTVSGCIWRFIIHCQYDVWSGPLLNYLSIDFTSKVFFSTYWVWRLEVWMTSAGFKGGANRHGICPKIYTPRFSG